MQQDMPWPEIGADAGGLEHRRRLPPWRRHLRPRPRPSAGPPGRSPLRRGDRPPAWAGYALAAALALAGFAARRALEGVYQPPFLTFGPAVLVAALAFGAGPGCFATLLGAALGQWAFAGAGDGPAPRDPGEAVGLAGFLALGLLASGGAGALRRANRRLAEARALLAAVVEGAPDPIFAKDAEGRYVLANAPAARALGAPREALPGRRDRDLLPPEQAAAIERVDREVVETGRARFAEVQVAAPGAEPRWFATAKAPWRGPDGRVAGVVGVARDIHERRLAEARLRAADAQKAALLAETNHRLKNALQAIAAILHRDGARSGDARVRAALEDAAGRLRVLARAHERLRLGGGGDGDAAAATATVGVRGFLDALAADLGPTLLAGRAVALEVEAEEEVELPAERAVPLGLVVNEAVTNALKHAFPEGRTGTVRVRFAREGGGFALTVADDGIGPFPAPRTEDDGAASGGSGGTRLIGALARQLGGRAEWRGPPGTTVVVTVPGPDAAPD
jgi:PAS domain S-box-containing protein